MEVLKSLRSSYGKRVLFRENEPARNKQGSNYHSAKRVAFLYLDTDEEFFKNIKKYATYLKNSYGIKSVHMMGFVDRPEKQAPIWQQHVLESDFFTRTDLNWYLRPVNRVQSFIQEEFDILIDFTSGDSLPINFVLKQSRALMKVGQKGAVAERYGDFIIDMGNQTGIAKYVEQLNSYLSNPLIK
jgi:hypothetical protein